VKAVEPAIDGVGLAGAQQSFPRDTEGWHAIGDLEERRRPLALIRFGSVIPQVEEGLALLGGE
jgi:hypothetical protein